MLRSSSLHVTTKKNKQLLMEEKQISSTVIDAEYSEWNPFHICLFNLQVFCPTGAWQEAGKAGTRWGPDDALSFSVLIYAVDTPMNKYSCG